MEFSQEISYVYSPTSSTEEDEDMAANCLILLAQGGYPSKRVAAGKISSRKFSEMATTTAGAKPGLYVYECKTCNRTFPSFQALGGHRASHKKPKLMDHEHPHQVQDHYDQLDVKKQSPPPPLSAAHSNGSNKAKIHECSICGAEFSSGQALGGHMRRHRPPTSTTPAAKASVSNSNDDATESSDGGDGDNHRAAVFSLDLNLPAPQEEDVEVEEEGGNKFEFSAKQQQSLVFSVPALVDCHY